MNTPENLSDQFDGKRIAITGACGTVGAELVRQLAQMNVSSIEAIDQDETALFFLGERYKNDQRVTVRLADIRKRSSLDGPFAQAQIVLHVAALKHVPLCEGAPMEAVLTNISGTQNVIDSAAGQGVERVVFTSTDKAVNPTNVMGTSKLMAERLMTAADQTSPMTSFSTRFGNVLGSRGSVMPLFTRQIAMGGPVTLTDPAMTRFIMTLDEAAELVLRSVHLGSGGEVFITKMPVVNIKDLAEVMVRLLAPRFARDPGEIEIQEVGPRPGEKQYEELMNEEEIRRSVDIGEFLVVEPALSTERSHVGQPVERPYNSDSEDAMTQDELASYLTETGLLEQLIAETTV